MLPPRLRAAPELPKARRSGLPRSGPHSAPAWVTAAGGGRGAGTGAIAGTAVGAGQAERAQLSLQQRYDIAYQQCMYAKGNQVLGFQPAAPPPPPPPPSR